MERTVDLASPELPVHLGTPGKDGKDGAAGAPGKDGADGAAGGACTTPAPGVIGSINFGAGDGSVDIYELNGSFENPTTIGSATGGAGAGKVKFNELTIKKTVDGQSPRLFTQLATGGHYAQVVLTIHRQSKPDATLTLGTVFLTSLSHETAPDPIKTFEKVGMVFGTAALAADGSVACWDQVRNVSCP